LHSAKLFQTLIGLLALIVGHLLLVECASNTDAALQRLHSGNSIRCDAEDDQHYTQQGDQLHVLTGMQRAVLHGTPFEPPSQAYGQYNSAVVNMGSSSSGLTQPPPP
jgi:hypothetical protein